MLRHFFFVNKNTLLVCVCVFLCHSDSHGDQWEWGAGVSREDRPSPATRRRPEARPSGQWTQVHGHLPETANLLLTLQRFYLVGHKTHRLDPTHLPSCFLHPTRSLCVCVCVCPPIGACWGSRDTNVRVSTFLCRLPISLHIIYYLSTRTQEGLHAAEWQLWFGLKPPSARATADLRHTNNICC